MPIILYERKDKDIYLEPKNIKQLQQKLFKFDNVWKNNKGLRKDIPGVQQAKHVVNSDYNTNNDTKQEGQISQLEAERIIHHDKTDKNGKSVFHQLFDSDTMNDIKSKLNQVRTQQKPTLPQKDNNKKVTLPSVPSVKEVQPQKPTSVTESVDYSEVKFYEYLENYSVWEIFGMFENGENPFSPLINPSMYQKALSEFVKFGKFTNFPTKHIYQWMGIIMKNTAILASITEIAGHTPNSPLYEFIDYYFGNQDDPDEAWKIYKESNDFDADDDYSAMIEFLEERGFFKWSLLPDGSDAWSDFGLEPLEKICVEYNENKSPEEVIVLINKALDITHQRGDLASMFIVGGSKTLTAISESYKTKKTIFINENQLNILKEYRNQLILPFDGDDRKMNYEHFVDWLEEIGTYGKLPQSTANIESLIENNTQEAYESFINWEDSTYDSFFDFMNICIDKQEDIYSLFDVDTESIDEILESKDYWQLYDYLNNVGEQEFEKFRKDNFNQLLEDFIGMYQINDRGLLYVERAIEIPMITDKTFKTYSGVKNDLYNFLQDNYGNHIGQYWSWYRGKVQSSGGYYSKTNNILICGYVAPESVDWEETIAKQAYGLRDEKEIFINYNEPIEITNIKVGNNKSLPLNGPIIVKA